MFIKRFLKSVQVVNYLDDIHKTVKIRMIIFVNVAMCLQLNIAYIVLYYIILCYIILYYVILRILILLLLYYINIIIILY